MMPYPGNKASCNCGCSRAARHAGFSLLEIMIGIVIVALLAAIAYPSYTDAVRKAKRAEGRTAMMQLMEQQERYYSRYNTYISFSRSDPQGFKWFSGNSAPSSAYEISASACDGAGLQNCVL